MTLPMTIQALAAATRSSVDTIRYYERVGLLPAAPRGLNNYRQYDTRFVDRLQFILACRDLDMSIEEISTLLQVRDQPSTSCEAVTHVIAEHLGHVRERLKTLKQLQRELQQLQGACAGQGDGAECGTLQAIEQRAPTLALRRTRATQKSHLG
jgi:DNA-binding transcriptional MerR regulator